MKKQCAIRWILFAFVGQFLFLRFAFPYAPNKIQEILDAGLSARINGDFRGALGFFLRAESLLKDSPSLGHLKTDAYENLGIIYWDLGQIAESLGYFEKAEENAQAFAQKEKRGFSSSAIRLTKLYLQAKELRELKKDYKESTKTFEEAIAIARKIKSGDHETKCLRQLSINYYETNNQKEYFHLNLQAREISVHLNIRREYAFSLFNLGQYYYNTSIYSLALENYENSLKIAEELASPSDEADCRGAIAAVLIEVGQYDKALDYQRTALAIYKEQGDKSGLARTLLNMGVVYRRRGFLNSNRQDLLRALGLYEQYLGLVKSEKKEEEWIINLNNIGSVYYDLADYAKALDFFREALDRANQRGSKQMISMVSSNIGIVQSTLGNYEESTKYYQRAIDLALQFEGGKILWEAYLEMANALKKQGKYTQALDNYRNSIAVIEDIRSKIGLEDDKASYLGTSKHIEPYIQIIDLLLLMDEQNPRGGFKEQAFQYLERGKARAFLDSLEVAGVEVSERADFRLSNKEREISGQLSKLYARLASVGSEEPQRSELLKEIQSVEMDYESLKREIRLKDPAYANLHYPAIATLKEIRRDILDSRTAVCAYSVGKERSFVFIITDHDLKTAVLPNRSALQSKIMAYLKIITDRDSRDFGLGQELGRILIPVEFGPRISRLIIIPDDWLNLLPFEALRREDKESPWFVQRYEIDYAPSLSSYLELLRRQHGRKPRKLDLLAFGDPGEASPPAGLGGTSPSLSAGSGSSAPLKYSRQEIKAISALFGRRRTQTAVGKAVNEQAVKNTSLGEFKIIHFATHAFIDDKDPDRSYLWLSPSPDQTEDGFLQAREVFGLRINADLVTLAACQTGLGQLIRGEGIEGLNRAFFYAGASAILMSLWSVDDQASAQLMERFYSHLRSNEPITRALQATKLEMIGSQALSHPFYWAGYILSGQAEARIFSSPWKKILFPGLCLIVLGLSAGLWLRREKRRTSLR
jgi:tetratricopeptide (TPR) repeat protein